MNSSKITIKQNNKKLLILKNKKPNNIKRTPSVRVKILEKINHDKQIDNIKIPNNIAYIY